MDPSEKTSTPGQSVAQAAAATAAADPVTAELLAKHSAGVKLTQQEYGKLGAFKASVTKFFAGKGGAPGQSAQPGAQPGNPAAVGSVAPGQTSANGLPPVPPDTGLVRRTTGTLLNKHDAITARWITNVAKRAGADNKTVAVFDSKARFPKDDRELMIELSPDVAAELGVNPRQYALSVFFGTWGLHLADLWLLADDLRKTAEKVEKASAQAAPAGSAPASATTQPGPGPGPTLPTPPLPKGHPPIVT